jgi:tetratricopeptide (TPR) repeat protein
VIRWTRITAVWREILVAMSLEPTTTFAVARLEEIGEISDGREPWRPVRHHFGITSFGINAWTGHEAADRIINEHDEEGEDEEVYFVHSGRARFELEGEHVDAPAGTFVFARPGVKRTAFAEEPGTTILAVGATPGQAYEPDGSELWAPFGRLYQDGRYAEAADQAREVAAAHPEYPALLYNLACCESLAGRKLEAIEHLRLAIERSDATRHYLADDSDLDPLREEPAFQTLLEGQE